MLLQKKICMLGASAVGKTSLVRRFVESHFSDNYLTTVGIKISMKSLRVGDQDFTLALWDIYGEDEFQRVRMSYLGGAGGYLLVADGTRQATLGKALALKEQAEKTLGPVPFVVALNKVDLVQDWEIETGKEEELIRQGCHVTRTSAKTGEGVDSAFHALATLLRSV